MWRESHYSHGWIFYREPGTCYNSQEYLLLHHRKLIKLFTKFSYQYIPVYLYKICSINRICQLVYPSLCVNKYREQTGSYVEIEKTNGCL